MLSLLISFQHQHSMTGKKPNISNLHRVKTDDQADTETENAHFNQPQASYRTH